MLRRADGRRSQQRLEHIHAAICVKILHRHAVKAVEHRFALDVAIHVRAADDRVAVVNAHAQAVLAGVIQHPRRDIIRQRVFVDHFVRLHVRDAGAVVADGVIAVFRQLQLIDVAPHAARRSARGERDGVPHPLDVQNRFQRLGRDILLRVGQRAVDIQHEQLSVLHASSCVRLARSHASTCICAVLALAAIWSMTAKTVFSISLPLL